MYHVDDKDLDDMLLQIAQKHLSIDTLDIRYSDRLDFYDVGVDSLRDMLRDAFEIGFVTSTNDIYK